MRKRMTAQLPAAFIREETRARLAQIAAQEERSISDIIRESVELFLAENDRKSAINDSNAAIYEE